MFSERPMARIVREVRLQERSARARLTARHHPYWRSISEGRHLGYYRGRRGGSWIARCRPPDGGDYLTKPLGTADDLVDADGDQILNWKQALDAALGWCEQVEKPGYKEAAALTVQVAAEEYAAMRDARDSARAGRPQRSDGRSRLTKYVVVDQQLARINLNDLTESDLKAWQGRLSGLKVLSRQRLANDLKAALNHCFHNHRRALPPDFPITVKVGLKSEEFYWEHGESVARENQILEDAQVRAILRIAQEQDQDGDFALLVILLAATGARFSQLRRMTVADVQLDQSRLLVPTSYKGKGRSPGLIKVCIGADVVQLLRHAVIGRKRSEPLLQRWRYRQVSPTKWVRATRGPWKSSSEMTRPWKCVVAAAGLEGTIPYALRHTSIVRGIRAGLPIRLVAAIHDTSVTMIERHYSRWITEGLEELAARAVVPLLAA
jgi:integrase